MPLPGMPTWRGLRVFVTLPSLEVVSLQLFALASDMGLHLLWYFLHCCLTFRARCDLSWVLSKLKRGIAAPSQLTFAPLSHRLFRAELKQHLAFCKNGGLFTGGQADG